MTIKEKVVSLNLPTSKTIDVLLLLSEVGSKAAGLALHKPSLFKGDLGAPASILSILEMPHDLPPLPKSIEDLEAYEQLFDIKLQNNG